AKAHPGRRGWQGSGVSAPTADKGRPDQQRQPDDDHHHAEHREPRVTGHAPAVHRAGSLSDPQRPQRAEDDTSDTANPHQALRSFRATGAKLEAPCRYIRISVESRLMSKMAPAVPAGVGRGETLG